MSEKLERVYEQSQFVAQIFIHGDSFRNHIVAIVFPEYTNLKTALTAQGIKVPETLSRLLEEHKELVYKLIERDMDQLAVANKFNSLEKVKTNFRAIDTEFEIGTILTPTMKLRRNQAKVTFSDLIDDIYANSPESKVQL